MVKISSTSGQEKSSGCFKVFENDIWFIFPETFTISELIKSSIIFSIAEKNITVFAKEAIIDSLVEWKHDTDLTLRCEKDIIFDKEGRILNRGSGTVSLKAGIMDDEHRGTVIFKGSTNHVYSDKGGKIVIHYNPSLKAGDTCKYCNPHSYLKHVVPHSVLQSYMLINTAEDLQNIKTFLHGNYALSNNINASETYKWHSGKGFLPLKLNIGQELVPFTGNFDGNNFKIENLFINRPEEDDVGIFGSIAGSKNQHVSISNLKLQNITVNGSHYVGMLAGEAEFTNFENIDILSNCAVKGESIVGGIVGSASGVTIKNINFPDHLENFASFREYGGVLSGAIRDSVIYDEQDFCLEINRDESGIECNGYMANVTWE